MKNIDLNKLSSIELTLEEVALLKSLWKIETILRLGVVLKSDFADDDKLMKMVGVFDSYRQIDDQFIDIYYSLEQSIQSSIKAGDDIKNLVVIPKTVVNVYRNLCIQTAEDNQIPEVKELSNKLGGPLLSKIEKSLKSPLDPRIFKKFGTLKEDPNDLPINILGTQGIC